MASASVKEFTSACWAEVYNRIIGAVVFVDEATAECLHWEGGLFNIMFNGAKCVKLLSPFEFCPPQYKKAVFITQTDSVHLQSIRDIIQNAEFTHCILISTISLEVLYSELVKDKDKCDAVASGQAPNKAVDLLTGMMYEWMGRGRYYPANDSQLLREPVADLQALHVDERSRVRRLACALNSMLDSMNLKEDVYFMGSYSSLVAGVLENSPIYINRRKVSSYINHPDDVHISPGCLYHPDDDACAQTFDHMINKTQKEVMLDVYNKLSKIDVHKSPSPKNLLKVTPQSLEKIINANKGNYSVIGNHLGVLQQGLALVQMHKSPKRATMDLLMNLEKQVLQSLATSRESTSVLTQIAHLINSRKQRGLPLINLIGLLVHVYSLTGTEFPLPPPHRAEVHEALTGALAEEWRALLTAQADDMSIEMARQVVDDIMILHK
ncbi:Sec1 family domain-containing protein 2 [Operophtera brumata]|uniref:Sec1 family domain-containing protein 2 n=1 Tax=Operophtera brumata TaxID=104452 RepID=A0A0L7L2T5_OPEBR|nr:Sec1 family domain-containing protein 2 [Operophtera brumata]